MDGMGAPDGIGELVGWRTWTVMLDGTLRSRCDWPYDGPLTAECDLAALGAMTGQCRRPRCFCQEEGHEAPDEDCRCGVYAVREPLDLVGQPGAHTWHDIADESAVAGQVALWGKVIEHERGYRAQFARPVALALPPDPSVAVLAAQERYGLPSVADEGLYEAMRGRDPSVRFGAIAAAIGVSMAEWQRAADNAMAQLAATADEIARLGDEARAIGVDDGGRSGDNPVKPAKPAYAALNPNDPSNRRRRPPRRL